MGWALLGGVIGGSFRSQGRDGGSGGFTNYRGRLE